MIVECGSGREQQKKKNELRGFIPEKFLPLSVTFNWWNFDNYPLCSFIADFIEMF